MERREGSIISGFVRVGEGGSSSYTSIAILAMRIYEASIQSILSFVLCDSN